MKVVINFVVLRVGIYKANRQAVLRNGFFISFIQISAVSFFQLFFGHDEHEVIDT